MIWYATKTIIFNHPMKKLFILSLLGLSSASFAHHYHPEEDLSNKTQLEPSERLYAVGLVHKKWNDFPRKSDQELWGQEDYWATTKELKAKGFGDDEDISLAKYQELKDLSKKKHFIDRVLLVNAHNLKKNERHIFLEVWVNGSAHYLRSDTDGILSAAEMAPDYRVAYKFTEKYGCAQPENKFEGCGFISTEYPVHPNFVKYQQNLKN